MRRHGFADAPPASKRIGSAAAAVRCGGLGRGVVGRFPTERAGVRFHPFSILTMSSIIERARRYVLKCDRAVSGQRGHDRTFHVACVLVQGFDLADADALVVLREWNGGCSPPWNEGELIHKVQSARTAAHDRPRGYLLGTPVPTRAQGGGGAQARARVFVRPAKGKFYPMVLKRIAGKVAGIANIVEFIRLASPVEVTTQDSASVLRHLYQQGSGEKVLIFSVMESHGQFLWEADRSSAIQKEQLPAGEDGVWFLPQPVTGEYYPNPRQGGKLSRRSEEAVTSWRYAVLESDEADADDWLRCLVQLPLRIACICESGGRSIHALVRVDAASKAGWDALIDQMKPALVALGACRGALTAVRLTRLPQARRGQRLQRLLYLNPAPDGTPIVRLGGSTKGAA